MSAVQEVRGHGVFPANSCSRGGPMLPGWPVEAGTAVVRHDPIACAQGLSRRGCAMPAVDPQLRRVGSGIRAFLLVAAPLAFLGGRIGGVRSDGSTSFSSGLEGIS